MKSQYQTAPFGSRRFAAASSFCIACRNHVLQGPNRGDGRRICERCCNLLDFYRTPVATAHTEVACLWRSIIIYLMALSACTLNLKPRGQVGQRSSRRCTVDMRLLQCSSNEDNPLHAYMYASATTIGPGQRCTAAAKRCSPRALHPERALGGEAVTCHMSHVTCHMSQQHISCTSPTQIP